MGRGAEGILGGGIGRGEIGGRRFKSWKGKALRSDGVWHC